MGNLQPKQGEFLDSSVSNQVPVMWHDFEPLVESSSWYFHAEWRSSHMDTVISNMESSPSLWSEWGISQEPRLPVLTTAYLHRLRWLLFGLLLIETHLGFSRQHRVVMKRISNTNTSVPGSQVLWFPPDGCAYAISLHVNNLSMQSSEGGRKGE